jgi:hypothetical protein
MLHFSAAAYVLVAWFVVIVGGMARAMFKR